MWKKKHVAGIRGEEKGFLVDYHKAMMKGAKRILKKGSRREGRGDVTREEWKEIGNGSKRGIVAKTSQKALRL